MALDYKQMPVSHAEYERIGFKERRRNRRYLEGLGDFANANTSGRRLTCEEALQNAGKVSIRLAQLAPSSKRRVYTNAASHRNVEINTPPSIRMSSTAWQLCAYHPFSVFFSDVGACLFLVFEP